MSSPVNLAHVRRVAAILCGVQDHTYWENASAEQKRYWIRRATRAQAKVQRRRAIYTEDLNLSD